MITSKYNETICNLIKEIFDDNLKDHNMYEWKGTIRNLEVTFDGKKYIIEWIQAFFSESNNAIVTDVPCSVIISNNKLITILLKRAAIELTQIEKNRTNPTYIMDNKIKQKLKEIKNGTYVKTQWEINNEKN